MGINEYNKINIGELSPSDIEGRWIIQSFLKIN